MPRFRSLLRWALLGALGLAVLGLIAVGTLYYMVSSRLPDVATLRHVELQEPMYVYARDGRLMAIYGETRRYPVRISEVPEQVKQAFIAVEDNRFYQHHGIDYKGVARAVWLLATTDDKRVPGGSTITQQVARQFFLSSQYSYTRKFAEMLLAMKMERVLTKDEILELYLNKSFFGNRAYGVAAAAEFYYGKPLAQLSLDEAASLASIPKFPSSGNPISNPERARERRDYALGRMAELGFIPQAQARAAQSVPMHASPHERKPEVYAPYVAEMVRREMLARFGGDVLDKGYHVTTTIDPVLQAAADKAVRDGLATYDHRHGWNKPEQHFELADGEGAAEAAARIRAVPVEGGLLPAVVLRSAGGGIEVALADGSTATLGADAARWTGKSAASLVARGDLVRLRPVFAADAPAGSAPSGYLLDQVPLAQAALVSLDADNGALRALVGGYSFAGNKFNRATQARRQPARASSRSCTRPRSNAASTLPRSCSTRRWCSGSPRPHLAPAERQRQLRRADAPARGAGAVAQPGVGAPARRDRRRLRAQVHQPLRHRRTRCCRRTCRCRWHRLAAADVHRRRLRGVRQRRLPGHAVVHRHRPRPRRQGRVPGEAADRLPQLRRRGSARLRADAGVERGRRLQPRSRRFRAGAGRGETSRRTRPRPPQRPPRPRCRPTACSRHARSIRAWPTRSCR